MTTDTAPARLGFALALTSCAGMGMFAAPLWLTLALCGICLTLLFLEIGGDGLRPDGEHPSPAARGPLPARID